MMARQPAKRTRKTAGEAGRRLTGLFLDMLAAERGAQANTLAAYGRDLADFAADVAQAKQSIDSITALGQKYTARRRFRYWLKQ